jgi:lipopolysaccharide transport system permease protein
MGAHVVAITTDIVPARGWQAVNIRELWQFRELLYFLVWRDVKIRYKQTVLGAAWAILQPALMMVVFTIFLGRMANVPAASDPVFVYAGMLPWTFFASAMVNAGNSLVNSERLITKVYFPRLAVPLSAVGAAMVDFAIASTLLVAMMIWRGIVPGAGVLMVPVIFGLLAMLAAGVGTLLGALTVAYRDFRHIIPFLAQFWLFATPAAYSRPPADASPLIKALIAANPVSGLIASFRAALFGEPIPWSLLASAAVLAIIVLIAGALYFRRVEDSFADIV